MSILGTLGSSSRAIDDAAHVARVVGMHAHRLEGAPHDFDPILELAAGTRWVLLGEASHGTHDFYRVRAEITKRLITEFGFSAVAVEADWPDAFRVNRYVRGEAGDADADEALAGFTRFPQWMWRNADVLDFVGWLRAHNEALPPSAARVGFYGLDLYSMHASMAHVLAYLDVVDPEAAHRARARYACFDHFGEDPQEYGFAVSRGMSESCEREVVEQLVEMQRTAGEWAVRDGKLAPDAHFFAQQNARLVRNAEAYYRAMFRGGAASWNVRDRHMFETLNQLGEHLRAGTRAPARVVVWAHNSHLGNAAATEMARHGELNLGQLVRHAYGTDALLVGFSTYAGTVTAASDWGGPAQRMAVRPGLRGSYEALLHDVGGRLLLDLRRSLELRRVLDEPRLQRAIGVIYRPQTERMSHYFETRLPEQFDCLLHYDTTRAVEPLERTGLWEGGELPATYPTAL
ncbi:MAG TPA: erythromycin esterase family protein [Gemmatimonadaceae bacterium]|nr:erythromycin esterase family protein [Gemmatimonadaceae bacterium]